MPDQPGILAALAESNKQLTQSIRDLTANIDALRNEMAATYVRKDVLDPQLKEIRGDIDAHQNWLTWAQRIVIGAVFLALLALVIKNQVMVP